MRIAVESQQARRTAAKRTVQRLNHYNPQPRIHRAQSRIQQLEYRLAELCVAASASGVNGLATR